MLDLRRRRDRRLGAGARARRGRRGRRRAHSRRRSPTAGGRLAESYRREALPSVSRSPEHSQSTARVADSHFDPARLAARHRCRSFLPTRSPHPQLRALHPHRHHRRGDRHRPPAAQARRRAGHRARRHHLGGAARPRRRARLARRDAPRTTTSSRRPALGLFVDGTLNPTSVYAIWSGGNAIFGSLLGGAIGAWIGCRLAGHPVLVVRRRARTGHALAQILGRLGNYFNQELFGQPTDLPWGLEINDPNAVAPGRSRPRHAVPPDVPLRDALEHLRARHDPAARAPVQAPVGQGLGALHDRVRHRPHLVRVDPHRPERGASSACARTSGAPSSRSCSASCCSSCRPATTPVASPACTCRVASGRRTMR